MSLDSIIGYIIVPAIFLWLGVKIYKHEKEPIDKLINKIKSLFESKDDGGDESIDVEQYQIKYGYGH